MFFHRLLPSRPSGGRVFYPISVRFCNGFCPVPGKNTRQNPDRHSLPIPRAMPGVIDVAPFQGGAYVRDLNKSIQTLIILNFFMVKDKNIKLMKTKSYAKSAEVSD